MSDLNARAKVGKSKRGGFYESVLCAAGCGEVIDRRNHPTRTKRPRKTCGRNECVRRWAVLYQRQKHENNPDYAAYQKQYAAAHPRPRYYAAYYQANKPENLARLLLDVEAHG